MKWKFLLARVLQVVSAIASAILACGVIAPVWLVCQLTRQQTELSPEMLEKFQAQGVSPEAAQRIHQIDFAGGTVVHAGIGGFLFLLLLPLGMLILSRIVDRPAAKGPWWWTAIAMFLLLLIICLGDLAFAGWTGVSVRLN